MSFNIWERWPWTSFQNLNLDWLMKAVKEALTTAQDAAASVGQFDARITANTTAIDELSDEVETISSPVRVFVSTELEARYRGNLITGAELLSMAQTHGDLPYVEYNGEVYMLDTASAAGDLRFSMGHTVTGFNDLVIRHIAIPAQSSNAAYSITNVSAGGSGSTGNVFAVKISPNPTTGEGYICDHTYAEIYSQMQSGRIPVLLVASGGNTLFDICGMGRTDTRTVNGQSIACIRFADPLWMTANSNDVGIWTIDANNTIGHEAQRKIFVTRSSAVSIINDGETNALLKTAQTLTAAEQAQVQQNLGISGGGCTANAVLYTAQTLTDQQKAQARDNIGADVQPLLVTVANPSQDNPNYSVDKTAEEIRNNLYNLRLRFGLNEGVVIDSYRVEGSPPKHNIIFTVADATQNFVTYLEYVISVYYEGMAPTTADDVPTVTASSYTHNIGGGSLPSVTAADNGKFLRVVSGAWAADTVPSAENASFGGV